MRFPPEGPNLQHLDDDAELYALGLSDPDRFADVEAHLATCEPCRVRVVAAEEAAAALVVALPPVPAAPSVVARTSRPWTTFLATAAALVLGAVAAIEGIAAHGASVRLAQRDTALIALAGSHFQHVSLTPTMPRARGIVAKAIYARDGAWYYVIAENAGPNAHVAVRTPDGLHDAGALAPTSPATLFVRNPGRVQEFEIVSNGTVIARATPTY
jgi:anti-sigma factor RsiW